jgi:F-type H+-transporting ATPase subunit epsilon
MADFSFDLVAPDRIVFSGAARAVILPGSEGELTVLAGHAPMLSSLRAGVLTVQSPKGTDRVFVTGGFCDVSPEGLTVLAETVIPIEAIDRAEIAREQARVNEALRSTTDDAARQKLDARLTDLAAMEAVLAQ